MQKPVKTLDPSLPYFDIFMQMNPIQAPDACLPDGYSFSLFTDGDEHAWARIETAAGEFQNTDQALETFEKTFRQKRSELNKRLLFLKDPDGKKIGTICAYEKEPGLGQIHWVALTPEAQGKHLSLPLLAAGLNQLKQLGYARCMLHTSTWTWLAVFQYEKIGFVMQPSENENAIRQILEDQMRKVMR